MDDLLHLGLGVALFALAAWLVRERAAPRVEDRGATARPPGGPR